MKTVFEASSAVEAHMLQDVLRQQEIPAHVHGEFLPGAVGELPAGGLVRLVVDDEDYERAKAAIARWEATAIEKTPSPPRRPSSGLFMALCGLVVGVAGTSAFLRAPASGDGIDYNSDGVLDERCTLSPSGTLLETKVDRNFDGKIDYVIHFNAAGQTESADADDNFDGSFETHYHYKNGNVDRSEVDTSGDGLPDLKSYFVNGVIQSTEYINASTGLPVRVEHFVLGSVVTAEVDTDNDGKLDTRLTYSPIQELLRTEPLGPPQ